ncbi:hypothetical protein BHE74_00056119 [Ensete ventricosum]|nr:hypothetical protein GW17_00044523 [Ensete ventricosum]RWW38637.1 hypothetical protein BHE74_00056119 [Ensete ventricosum]RZR76672.1 hypothetical protein BHM03_00001534 [Ensete ventricosum]
MGSRKLVQSLKEIVNCAEAEIYAMLRECNMDPNEAVHRLLSQGAPPRNSLLSLLFPFYLAGCYLILLFVPEIRR